MNIKHTRAEWFTLKGETITKLVVSTDEVDIHTQSGRHIRLYHSQDCCESVRIVKHAIPQLPFGPIVLAEDDHPDTPDWWDPKYSFDSSHTWTSFRAVDSGNRELSFLWLGESNGYYGEGVSVKEITVVP